MTPDELLSTTRAVRKPLLGIPFDSVTQVALIPAAYTIGTDFTRAPRLPVDAVLHVDSW